MSCTQHGNYNKCREENCDWGNKDCKFYVGKTKGDKFRLMGDEELSELFTKLFSNTCINCPISNYHNKCKIKAESENITIHMACKMICLEWLHQEEVDN